MELWNFDKGKVIYDLSWSRDNEVVKKVLWIQIFNIYLDKTRRNELIYKNVRFMKKRKKKQWNSCSLWIIKIFYEILESISLKNEILDIVHRVSNCRIKHNLKLTNGVPSELRIARESENEKSQKYREHTLIDPSHKTKWNNQ